MNILLDIYLEKNLGDDLFLESILTRYPQHKFYVFAQLDYQEFEQKHTNFKVIRYNKLYNYLNVKMNRIREQKEQFIQKKEIDALVCIGGSIFSEFDGWEKLFNERRSLWKYMKSQQKPVYILGSNFGPFNSNEFIEGYYELFDDVEDICFRDKYSYDLFREKANVRKETDIIMGLPLEEQNQKIQKNTVGISVIDLVNRGRLSPYDAVYVEKLARMINEFHNEGKKVYLFSFCEREGDEQAIQKILAKVKNKELTDIIKYRGDIENFLNVFSQMEFFIATRFHSMILGLLFEINMYIVYYSDKLVNFIENCNIDIGLSAIEDIESLSKEQIVSPIDTNLSLENLIESANRQYKMLDKLLA